ncbi:MAG: hypothetical protein M0R17_02450 [Candidatus Omnitrophica bacterium]|nr:hypothetical protein [Candidatus Omnitrophota bacterium]
MKIKYKIIEDRYVDKECKDFDIISIHYAGPEGLVCVWYKDYTDELSLLSKIDEIT